MQKIIFWSFFILTLISASFFLYDFGFPFLVGFIISYFCIPFFNKINKLLKSRALAALTVSFLFMTFIIFTISFLVPILKEDLYNLISHSTPKLRELIPLVFQKAAQFLPADYITHIQQDSSKYCTNIIKLLVTAILKIFAFDGFIINSISLLFISPIVIFFCLRDYEKIKSSIIAWVPPPQRKQLYEFTKIIHGVLTKYVNSATHNIIVLLIFYTVTLTAIGMKYSIVIGIFSGIMAIIPYLGCLFGCILSSIIYISHTGDITYHLVLVLMVYVTGYLIESYVLAPKLGKDLGIHTLWIFFAFLAGIQICGIFGLIISIPMTALINASIRFGLKKFQQSKVYNQ